MITASNNNNLASTVLINSTARLHMGFFDLHGGLGRKFGSIGLSLATPAIALSAERSEKLHVEGEASAVSKVSAIAQQLMTKLNLNAGISINITSRM